MRLAWSKSTLPLSKLIRWGLGEPCSHFIIVFNDCVMFQSNLLGTGLDFWPHFKSHEATIVHEIPVPLDRAGEDKLFEEIVSKFCHKPYDWLGFFYFVYRAFLKRFFKRPMPTKNKWAQPDQFLCVGLAKALDTDGVPDWLRKAIRTVPDYEMISPEELYEILLTAEDAEKKGLI